MKSLVGIVLVVGLVLCQGCASLYVTNRHDSLVVQQNALQMQRDLIQAQPIPGGVALGVNLLALKSALKSGTGYRASWKDQPLTMSVASVVDALVAAGTAWAAKELTKDHSKSDSSSAEKPQVTVTGNGNIIYLGNTYSGSGNTTSP